MRDQNEQNDTQKKEQWSSLYSICSRDKLSTKLVFLITLMQIKPHLAVEQRHCGIPDHLCLHTRCVCVWLSLVAGRYLSVQRSPFDSSDEENQVPVDFGAVDKLVDVVWIHSLSRLEAGGADAVTRWNTNTHIFLHKHISWFLHTILWKYYIKKAKLSSLTSLTFRTNVSARNTHLDAVLLHLHLVSGTRSHTGTMVHHKVICKII